MSRIARGLIIGALALLVAGCAGRYFQEAPAPSAPTAHRLADWPYRELWAGIVFNGEKIGYAHLGLERAPDAPARYEIRSESALHFRLLGLDKRLTLRTRDRVREDFTLDTFEYLYHLDGTELAVSGRWEGDALRIVVTNAGRTTERTLPAPGPPYPQSAIGMIPAFRGLRVGAEFHYTVFSGEAQRLADVVQRVEAYERSTLFEGEAWRTARDERPAHDHVDRRPCPAGARHRPERRAHLRPGGRGPREALRRARRAQQARGAAGDEPDQDRDRDPGAAAGDLREARGEQPGDRVPAARRRDAALPSDRRRRRVRARLRAHSGTRVGPGPSLALDRRPEHRPADPGTRSHGRRERVRGTGQVQAILAWLKDNIRQEPVDSFSALDVLATRRAECQGHAYLYAALARALGIPTRVVNGLVYSPELGGFAYHAWNESLLAGEWVAVDPTFGQLGADATHLKLGYGESIADITPLLTWMGVTKIEVLAVR